MEKIKLVFAMSTLTTYRASSFCFPFIPQSGIERIDNCIGQLEPTAKYVLTAFPNANIEMIILCTKGSICQVKNTEKTDRTLLDSKYMNVPYSAVTFFVARILDYMQEIAVDKSQYDYDIDALVQAYSEESIFIKGQYDIGRIQFTFIEFDENSPSSGIKETVRCIKEHKAETEQLWIDTHGGFRDAALVLNGVVSLLEVYDIKPQVVLGTRHGNSQENTSYMVNQSESFGIFDFVSGMKEFINFGSADSLIDYYKESSDKSISRVISAMKRISDGTRMCDPREYIEGLNDLESSISQLDSNDDLFTIFIDYIKKDYGELLNKEKRTSLKIVKRCLNKKLYQQALTFIESLMPEEFVKNQLIYYSSNDRELLEDIQAKRHKEYVSLEHFFFDWVGDYVHYFNKETNNLILKNYKCNDFEGQDKDILAIACLKEFAKSNGNRVLKNIPSVVKRDYTNLNVKTKYELKEKQLQNGVGELIRLHNAIKRCRNMVNHSSKNIRPTIEELVAAMETYTKLADRFID